MGGTKGPTNGSRPAVAPKFLNSRRHPSPNAGEESECQRRGDCGSKDGTAEREEEIDVGLSFFSLLIFSLDLPRVLSDILVDRWVALPSILFVINILRLHYGLSRA